MGDEEFIFNFVPTGMVPMRGDTPHVPLSVEEIISEVAEVRELGITMVHLHVRDSEGRPCLDTGLYGELIQGIRELDAELVVCVSCSGRRDPELEARSLPLELSGESKPDMASLTLGSLNFTRQASVTAPQTLVGLANEMLRRGIVPELEVFDTGMMNMVRYLRDRGRLHDPCYVNVLLGNVATAQCEPGVLALLLGAMPPGAFWSLAGIGGAQLTANAMGLALGGGVRVGLEDNIYFDRGRKELATNWKLAERVHALAGLLGRKVMSPVEFRRRMRMAPGNGEYGREPMMDE